MSSYSYITPKELTSDQLVAIKSLDKKYFDWPWTDVVWSSFSLNGQYYIRLVESDGAIVAYSLYLLSPLEELAHLLKVLVCPEFRGQGIARSLILRDQEFFKTAGFNKIYLEVSVENNAAISLYENIGFKSCRIAKSFYGPGKDADTMIIEF